MIFLIFKHWDHYLTKLSLDFLICTYELLTNHSSITQAIHIINSTNSLNCSQPYTGLGIGDLKMGKFNKVPTHIELNLMEKVIKRKSRLTNKRVTNFDEHFEVNRELK